MATLSAFADEISDDFKEQLDVCESIGIKYIELRSAWGVNILKLSFEQTSQIKKMMGDRGFGLSAIGSPIGKIRVDEPFEPHLDDFKHAIDLAELFEAPFVRVFSYYPPEGGDIMDHRNEVMDRLHQQVELLEGRRAIMVHENEHRIYGETGERCLDLHQTVNSPKFKAAYDPANFAAVGIKDSFSSCWPMLKPHVIHFHIKDWVQGESTARLPGKGNGQLKETLADAKESGYDGFLTMEPHMVKGGQMGGKSGPESFIQATNALKAICDEVGMGY